MQHTRRQKRAAPLAVAAALTLTAGATLIPSAGASDVSPATAGSAQRVGLLTGDQVLLDGNGEFAGLLRADGRENIAFSVRERDEGLTVLPSDAEALVNQGVLDARLFDVTELSRPEYARVADGGLPVIVTYDGERPATQARPLEEAGAEVRAVFESVHGEALTLGEDAAAAAWDALTTADASPGTRALSPGVAGISLDGIVQSQLDTSVEQIGAPSAWDAGYAGAGVAIAVLDTGIDSTHPDLAGAKVIAEKNFTTSADAVDRQGHGTHVASTAAGTGAGSGGAYTGVAPEAELLNGKVLDDFGTGNDSGIIEGMEWAVEQGAQVVNMSLGRMPSSGNDPVVDSLNQLSQDSGTLFVVAAGNDGPGTGTLGSPAIAEAALSVGASDSSDALAPFSSTGPWDGDYALKPDLTGPGVAIGAAQADGTQLGETVADGYVAASGTSMATPHLAGAAALLAQRHPDWSGAEIKAALVGSTTPLAEDYSAYQQGSGRVDAEAATSQSVIAEPVSVSFGNMPWPHESDEPVTKELSYRNLGDQDVTLSLDVSTLGPTGDAAPEGMFTLATDEVTVPAGGTAAVDLTADTSLGGESYGAYSAQVTAEGDGQSLRTAAVVNREDEMYDLALHLTGRYGKPATNWRVSVQPVSGDKAGAPLTASASGSADGAATVSQDESEVVLRVPPGKYFAQFDQTVLDEDGEPVGADRILQPSLQVSEDTTVEFDSRETEEIDLTVFDESAERTDLIVGHDLVGGGLVTEYVILPPGLSDGFRAAHLGPELGEEEFTAFANTGWTTDDARYHTSYQRAGSYFTGLSEHLVREELAELSVSQGSSGTNRHGYTMVFPQGSPATGVRDFLNYESPLPYTDTEYVRGGDGEWVFEGVQLSADLSQSQSSYASPSQSFAAGERHDIALNAGVYGPSVDNSDGLYRQGDYLYSELPLFTDGLGNTLGNAVYHELSMTLYRDGEPFQTEEDVRHCQGWDLYPPYMPNCVRFEVSADEADYELTTTINRDGITEVSTEVTTSLSFGSATVPDDQSAPLPASAVRFTPELTLENHAEAGAQQTVPVAVEGSAAGESLGSLAVEVSFDSGGTWEEAAVEDGAVTVENPAAGGSVSLRAEVSDTEGNTTVQTIIDAYRTS